MKKTLAIYAIQDINQQFPEFIHDHNLAIFESGKIIKYLQLERITGVKYDNTLHKHLYKLLKNEKLFTQDFDLVFVDSVLGRSFINDIGNIRCEANPFEQLSSNYDKAICFWLDRQVHGYAVRHELAHIFSAVPFYGLFKENSLIVHFDGGASVSNVSIWKWQKGSLQLLDYGWQLKTLSSLFNANALNFFILGVGRKEHNSFPGKFMGYAGWGKYDAKIESWLIKNNFFHDIWQNKKRFFDLAKKDFGWDNRHFNTKDKFLQNIAATVQVYFTKTFVSFLSQWQQKTGTNYLYYTGGSALNLYTNSEILRRKIFEQVFIPPAPGDSGLSLGAAAFVEYQKGNTIELSTPYINNWGLSGLPTVDYPDEIHAIAQAIIERKILAIYNGFGEAGPRALGNRSIIALPNNRTLAKIISQIKKGRQWYRPLAPVMLKHVAQEVTGIENLPIISKFMLVNFKILPQYYNKLKGVIHADGSSRIQILFERNDNPFLWDLLDYLHKNYGVLALINTSFNAQGMPIVHFEHQAIRQAEMMKLDGLIINGKLHEFKYE